MEGFTGVTRKSRVVGRRPSNFQSCLRYCPFEKRRVEIFRTTSEPIDIKGCGFHHKKEAMKTHRTIYKTFFELPSQEFNSNVFKELPFSHTLKSVCLAKSDKNLDFLIISAKKWGSKFYFNGQNMLLVVARNINFTQLRSSSIGGSSALLNIKK